LPALAFFSGVLVGIDLLQMLCGGIAAIPDEVSSARAQCYPQRDACEITGPRT
jgi:hypothetical protein